jgi:hypothetical protein
VSERNRLRRVVSSHEDVPDCSTYALQEYSPPAPGQTNAASLITLLQSAEANGDKAFVDRGITMQLRDKTLKVSSRPAAENGVVKQQVNRYHYGKRK